MQLRRLRTVEHVEEDVKQRGRLLTKPRPEKKKVIQAKRSESKNLPEAMESVPLTLQLRPGIGSSAGGVQEGMWPHGTGSGSGEPGKPR